VTRELPLKIDPDYCNEAQVTSKGLMRAPTNLLTPHVETERALSPLTLPTPSTLCEEKPVVQGSSPRHLETPSGQSPRNRLDLLPMGVDDVPVGWPIAAAPALSTGSVHRPHAHFFLLQGPRTKDSLVRWNAWWKATIVIDSALER
jgi:hypothetical protein